jgi:hypothetical protein
MNASGNGMVVEPSAVSRNSVFVAGGQPSITYVEREALHIERDLTRSLSSPNQIVSLAGPTKCGKTVLVGRCSAKENTFGSKVVR